MTTTQIDELLNWYVAQQFLYETEREQITQKVLEGDTLLIGGLARLREKFNAGRLSDEEMSKATTGLIGKAPEDESGVAPAAWAEPAPSSIMLLRALGWMSILVCLSVGFYMMFEFGLLFALAVAISGLIGGAVLIGLSDIVRLLFELRNNTTG